MQDFRTQIPVKEKASRSSTNLLLCLLLVFTVTQVPTAGAHLHAKTFTGMVVRVADGDSFMVKDGGKVREVRLYGIDAPEWNQSHGREARKHVLLYLNQRVECHVVGGTDPYGREVSIVYSRGRCLNEELVSLGLAWVWPRNCRRGICSRWKELQKRAARDGLGLWKDAHPEPPWKYRQRQRKASRTSEESPSRPHAPFTGNASSFVFHHKDCVHAQCSRCTKRFQSSFEAMSKGYRPCRLCLP